MAVDLQAPKTNHIRDASHDKVRQIEMISHHYHFILKQANVCVVWI